MARYRLRLVILNFLLLYLLPVRHVGLISQFARRDVQAKFLLRNGADHVVYPEKQVAKWASIRYTDDHILDYMEVDASHAIFEVEVPKEWI